MHRGKTPATRESARAGTGRVLRALRDAVADSDLSYATIETRAGFERGYLSQLLTGRIELKVHHVFAVLEAIGRRRGAFFAAIFPLELRPSELGPTLARALRVGTDVVRIYSAGIEAVEGMRPRLRRCEEALTRLLQNEEVRRVVRARRPRPD